MKRRRILVFGAAVIAPAIALSVLAWRSLRQEEAERTVEIRAQAATELHAVLLEIEATLKERRERFWGEAGREPEKLDGRDGVAVSVRGAYPKPIEPGPSLEERIRRERPELLDPLSRAQEMELAKERPAEASSLYLEIESEVESPATRAGLLHARARSLARGGRPEEAKAAYEKLAAGYGTLVSESGVPFALVAKAQTMPPAEFAREVAVSGLPGHLRAALLRGLPDLPDVRDAIRSARALAALEDRLWNSETADALVRFGDRWYLLTFRGSTAAGLPLDPFDLRDRNGFAFELHGEGVARESSSEFASLDLSARVLDPARSTRSRGLVLGIIACLLAAILFGLFAMMRAVREELRLAQAKSDFVSGVSHDLKTPLTSIRMFAEMLATGRAEDPAEYHRLIHQESLRLSRLVENVLDFTRIEEGRKTFQRRETKLHELVAEVAASFHRDIRVKTVEVVAHVDPEAIAGALHNLIDNAVKYGGDGAIEVELTPREISVTDPGPGVAPEERERIFEKFYRGAAAVGGPSGGAGLGLYLVKRTMEAHGGSVRCEGNRFVLTL